MTNTRGRGHVVFSGHLVEPHLLAKRGLVQNPPPHLVWPAGQPPRARVIRTPCIIAPLLYHRLELFSTAYYSALHRLSLIANSLPLYYYHYLLLLHIYIYISTNARVVLQKIRQVAGCLARVEVAVVKDIALPPKGRHPLWPRRLSIT